MACNYDLLSIQKNEKKDSRPALSVSAQVRKFANVASRENEADRLLCATGGALQPPREKKFAIVGKKNNLNLEYVARLYS